LWRRYLTDRLLERYFVHKNFYHATNRKGFDNPGMRITDDVDTFTFEAVFFYNEYTGALSLTVMYPYKLAQIDPMLFLIFVYGILWAGVIYLIWGKMYALAVAKKSKQMANLRTGLVQTSEYSESVAFLGAEDYEQNSANSRYGSLERTLWQIAKYACTAESTYRVAEKGSKVMPFVLLAHRYFSPGNTLSIGKISEAADLFADLIELILKMVDSGAFAKLNNLAGAGLRIDEMDYVLDLMDREYFMRTSKRTVPHLMSANAGLEFQNVSLSTPGSYTQRLVRGLNMTIEPGASVIIVGPSGVGKSSLMRAICGLWQPDKGCIRIPSNIDPMFLPQQPYIPDISVERNTLRRQMCFPKQVSDMTDKEMMQILGRVNLIHLIESGKGLDTTSDWRSRLSGGEKQRLAMARLLIAKPQMAFLDEATSALDSANERRLYQEMANRGATYISIGHKKELLKFHKYVLELKPNGGWDFRKSEHYKME